jgi:ribosome maturation factor RimP
MGSGLKLTTAKQRLEEIAIRVVEGQGLEFVDLELKRQGQSTVVQVFADRSGGIGMDELQAVSREMSVLLDAEDPLEGHFILEVSSPGLDRPLQNENDYRRAIGRLVRITTSEPVGEPARTRHVGRVVAVADGGASLTLERQNDARCDVPLDKIESGRLEIEFK